MHIKHWIALPRTNATWDALVLLIVLFPKSNKSSIIVVHRIAEFKGRAQTKGYVPFLDSTGVILQDLPASQLPASWGKKKKRVIMC